MVLVVVMVVLFSLSFLYVVVEKKKLIDKFGWQQSDEEQKTKNNSHIHHEHPISASKFLAFILDVLLGSLV